MPAIPKLKSPKTVQPRGETIRPQAQGAQTPAVSSKSIPTIMVVFLIGIAIIADLIGFLGLIPVLKPLVLGFGAILGAILWVTYFALGARSALAVAAMALTYFIELVPVLSFLPTYTITAILVYLLMNTQVLQKAGATARFIPNPAAQTSRLLGAKVAGKTN